MTCDISMIVLLIPHQKELRVHPGNTHRRPGIESDVNLCFMLSCCGAEQWRIKSTTKDVSKKLLWILSRSVSFATGYQLVTIIAGMKDSFNRSKLRHASMISHKFEPWKCHQWKGRARFTLTLKLVSFLVSQKPQNPNSSLQFSLTLADKSKSFHFDRNLPFLTGFPDGNFYHVQRSHREKRLSLRLGHNEHDAEQVSAQQTQTDTCSFQYFALLLLRNSIQEWATVFFRVFLSMQMSAQGLSSNLIRHRHRRKNNHMNYRCRCTLPANLQTYSLDLLCSLLCFYGLLMNLSSLCFC